MQDNLVIVESPAKAKTIERFLGKDYKVMSSYGHIRDLKKKELSIDTDTLKPEYEIPDDKKKLVSDLRKNAKAAGKVWLASDEDREGEAISWHLCEVLGLDEDNTNRIVFHEITKPAILEAIQHPRHIDMNLVNAQQARRVLDRLVGFKISPVLWRKVKPSLSAGRVQSVAVRLIVEREREIQSFVSEAYYRVNAIFITTAKDGSTSEVKAELPTRFTSSEEATAFLEKCKNATFTIDNISQKPLKRTPAPPFTTSTLQQEAARKLGFTVSQTMMVAQRLYENGLITYMRTDSFNLSSLCVGASKKEIVERWGETYSKPRQYHTSSKGAQEAHEAIRPTYMSNTQIDGNPQEKRLYDLIWKRTAASQMADAIIEKTTVQIGMSNSNEHFIANGEVIQFDGFLKVYRESAGDEEENAEDLAGVLPVMTEGDTLQRKEITATERFTQCPLRYTEASLVKKLEELGIGRPSTYAPTISTIQQREYVQKGDKKGEERLFEIIKLKKNAITKTNKKEIVGSDKGKLLPTDTGLVVTDFLMDNFPNIMDYNFTATIEKKFDKVAEGKQDWENMIIKFYKGFEPNVEEVLNARSEHKAGERQLGIDPKSGKPVFVKIGRYGPIVQIGTADDAEKPRFAQLPGSMSMGSITLEEAMELFKLPRELGEYEDAMVSIGTGRFGPYILH
ncbi:MAG: type I DNA topoisomerase, partial [Prevotella sp.]|nr:type I DNA topoisomerase [Prevotella sp.]